MHYVIIGGSAAGINAIEAIRSVDREGEITLISEEEYSLYSRCLLTYYLAGVIPEKKLKYRPDDFFSKHKVKTILGVKAKKILAKDKKVKLSNKKVISFDKLLMTTGSSPKALDIPGEDKKGVFGVRSVKDIEGIKDLLSEIKTAVILGGGLIGLRAAYALNARGLDVKVIIKSNRVLSQMLDEGAAFLIQKRIEEKGIQVMTGLAASEILGGKKVEGLLLDNGNRLDSQLVIIGKGVVPNTDLVDPKEIKLDRGILVNDYLETEVPDIYAAGDCAQSKDLLTGERAINALWPCAAEQGKIAGLNMTGSREKYQGSMAMNSVEFFCLPTISLGLTRPKGEGYEVLVKEAERRNIYRKVILRDNRVAGVILVNDVDKAGIFYSLMRKKVDVSMIKDFLLEDNFDFAKILPLLKEHQDLFREKEYSLMPSSP